MSKRLTTRGLTDCRLAAERARRTDRTIDAVIMAGELDGRIEVFEAAVWFPRLRAQVNACDTRGMSADVQGLKILTWCCAGRCLIQMEENGHTLTLITADDEEPWVRAMCHQWPGMGPMGLQSIDAEFGAAMMMLYKATRHADKIELKPNESVTVAF